jgi:N-acetyltransferase
MMQFDFYTDHILENDKIVLRPLVHNDIDFLAQYSLLEPGIWKYNAWGAAGLNNLKTYVENAITQRQQQKEYAFIVFDKQKKKYSGSTRFYDFQTERKNVQIGYTWYGKNFQGTYLNKNCKYLLLDYAFSTIGAERVGFGANARNERSIMAMRSIGATPEGILRKASIGADGERIDTIILSILKEEWEVSLKEKLKLRL